MKQACVYKIQSTSTGEIYVGSTKCFAQRKRIHLSNLRLGKHPNRKLLNHVHVYGIGDLSFSVIESVTDISTLINREQHFMDTLNPMFNIAPNADSSIGVKHTEETKRKQSAVKRSMMTPERLRQMSEAQKGKKLSTETKLKISAASKANMTDERKKEISEFMKGSVSTKRRKVICLNTGTVYDHAGEAAEKLNCSRTQISFVCRGVRKSANNLQFSFV